MKGRPVGITSFGASSDFILPYALQKNGLDPNKDVSILQTGGQPEGLAAMASGKIFAQRMSFPLHLKAFEMGMRELVDFQLGLEENNGTVITTRSFIAQRRGTVIRFMRAFIRGMYRYKSDRQFAKKATAKFAQLDDQKMVEGTWQEYAAHLQKVLRPTLQGIQAVIDSGMVGKIDIKADRIVDVSIVDELEKSGFIDSVYNRFRLQRITLHYCVSSSYTNGLSG